MPYLATDGTFDLNSGAGGPSDAQFAAFLALPLLALLFVLLVRFTVRLVRDPHPPPSRAAHLFWIWLFLAPAALCPLGWVLCVRLVLPAGQFHDPMAALIALSTLLGLGAGLWWCAITREDSYA